MIINDINNKILSQHKPGEEGRVEKINQIEKEHGESIKNANIANPKAMAYILTEMIAHLPNVEKGKQLEYLMGTVRLLEGASGNVGGTRGLITWDALEVHGESMALYKDQDGKYFNNLTPKRSQGLKDGTVTVNTEHPYYKQAMKDANNDQSKALDLMKQKLEHQDVSANVNRENAKSMLEHALELIKFPSQSDVILESLNNNILYNEI